MRHVLLFLAVALYSGTSTSSSFDVRTSVAGLNLPRTQFDTNTGNFHPGVFEYGIYNRTYFDTLKHAGISGIRLGFNVDTALDASKLKEMVSIVQDYLASQTLGQGPGAAAENVLLCMWDTCVSDDCTNRTVDPTSHGDGFPNKDKDGTYVSFIQAWTNVRQAFDDAKLIPKFELFNEPFGFNPDTAHGYVILMSAVALSAGLDLSRVVLDGTGYADDVNAIAGYWHGLLAWHIYPNWVPEEDATAAAFKQKTLECIQDVSSRTYITEFGASLEYQESYDQEFPINKDGSGDVNMLLGLDSGLRELARSGNPVAGTFFWHGFTDADSYSYVRTDGENAFGLQKVQQLQRDAAGVGADTFVV